MILFNCDYHEGAHPAIMERMMATNMEQTVGYGEDPHCANARALIKKAVGDDNADVHFLVGGTQTNTTIIAAALRPYQGVAQGYDIYEEEHMKSIVIGIAGGTGSGKSTFTKKLKDAFKDDVAVLYHDNYYRDQREMTMEERKKINYDHPDAMETSLLVEHLKALKDGKAIECPTYDYTQYTRAEETVRVEPKKVILLEGILVLADAQLRELMDIKIYVEADADERILRRIIRDVKERGRDIEGVVEQYLTTVKPMHYLYVDPTRSMADIVINSGMNPVAFDLVKNTIQKQLNGEEVFTAE